MWVTVLAVCVANFMSVINQVGWVIQKIGIISKRNKTSLWAIGFSLMIIAAIVQIFVLPFADLTLLSTTNATGIATGVLFGIFWLKEPFNVKIDLPALILMISGCVALGFLTRKEVVFYTTEQILALVSAPAAQAYYVTLIILIVLTIINYRVLMSELAKFEKDVDEKIDESELEMKIKVDKELSLDWEDYSQSRDQSQRKSLINKFGDASEIINGIFIEEEKPDKKCFWGTFRDPRLLLIAISRLTFVQLADISARSKLLKRFQKIPLVTLLSTTATLAGLNQSQLKVIGLISIDDGLQWQVVLLFIYTAIQAIVLVLMMNLAMAHYPQLDVVPIYESLVIAMSITAGMIFFDEGADYNARQMAQVVTSGVVIIAGIMVIALKSQVKENQAVNADDEFSKVGSDSNTAADTKRCDEEFLNVDRITPFQTHKRMSPKLSPKLAHSPKNSPI